MKEKKKSDPISDFAGLLYVNFPISILTSFYLENVNLTFSLNPSGESEFLTIKAEIYGVGSRVLKSRVPKMHVQYSVNAKYQNLGLLMHRISYNSPVILPMSKL